MINDSYPIRQQGVAVLAILAILIIVLSAAVITSVSLNKNIISTRGDNAKVLKNAKDYLLGYSIQAVPPGLLPCPDYDGDGESDNQGTGEGATCRTELGFFPYKTLGSKELRDGSGSRLWYAVELTYARETPSRALNSSLVPSLTVNGASASAVVLSPGESIGTAQRRDTDNADRYNRYLEGLNGDADKSEYTLAKSDSNNDELLTIYAADHWSLLAGQVLASVAQGVENYFGSVTCAQYPWASNDSVSFDSTMNLNIGFLPIGNVLASGGGGGCPVSLLDLLPSWFEQHWSDQIQYAMCEPSSPACLSVAGDKMLTVDALLVSPGIPLSTQSRPSANLADYFEGENNTSSFNFESRFLKNHDEDFNDVLHTLSP